MLLILVHSYYFWSEDRKGDYLHASFNHFIISSHPAIITSAIQEAFKSHGKEPKLLCEKIIQITMNYPLGKFIILLSIQY